MNKNTYKVIELQWREETDIACSGFSWPADRMIDYSLISIFPVGEGSPPYENFLAVVKYTPGINISKKDIEKAVDDIRKSRALLFRNI